MPVAKLPPGEYVLRAVVTSSGEPLKTLTRRFEIAPPAVLMTSAAGAAPAPTASAELFLPVEETALIRPFGRDDALRPQVVDDFLKRVPTSTRPMFEQGIAELQKANYAAAEINFKTRDPAGRRQHVGAGLSRGVLRRRRTRRRGRRRLADRAHRRQRRPADLRVARRDAGAGARLHARARSILEEAVGRWPSDTRFDRTLALSYATLGKGRDAIRVLDRYIADGRREPDLLFLMVEWLFQVHSSRAVVINRAADLAMARNYAAEYAKANGPKQALVQQWVDFLANEKP